MSKAKARAAKQQVARLAAKAERIGFAIPPEVREELRMPEVEGFNPDAAREKYVAENRVNNEENPD